MRWANVIAILASVVAVSSAEKPGPFKMLGKHQERMARLEKETAKHQAVSARQVSKPRAASKFFNEKTAQFSVNGSSLPQVDFDIGESYAGVLPIGNSTNTDLFFWFFPSTNEAAKEEVVLWFTGGPGCSSMSAFLEENGPFTWKPGTYAPVENPWSWHRLSNVIWIDQPVGTGYDVGSPTYHDEFDVATQFRGFWKNFVDIFGMQNYKIYITGESYAGLYCPYIAGGMIDQNDTTYFDVGGMIVYDGVLSDVSADAVTVPFVDHWAGLFPFNKTFSDSIHSRHESCGYAAYLDKYLVFPPAGLQPNSAGYPGLTADGTEFQTGCYLSEDVYEAILELNPCFNIYEVSAQCPLPYDPLGFPSGNFYTPPGAPTVYFNRSDVKAALNVPNASWTICKNGVFPYGDRSPPSSLTQIPKVIDKTENVMLVHGMLDMVLFLNDTLLTIQNMTWGGKLGFQEEPSAPLYVPFHENTLAQAAGAGTLGVAHTERGLTYMGVELSGHMVPECQPGVAYRQLEVLLGRVANVSSTEGFTTTTTTTTATV